MMPVLFVGHGNPMNAIEDNAFRRGWAEVANRIPRPKAILCISAHWETEGVFVTGTEAPETIHDFFGFPQALFDVRYPAPGSLALQRDGETVEYFNDDVVHGAVSMTSFVVAERVG